MKVNDKIIDVSEHRSYIDWSKVKKTDVKGVIIRCGYGKTTEDKYFIKNVQGCQKVGMPIIGVYEFMYAINNQEAKANAENAIRLVQKAGLPRDTTIWADVEYDTVDNAKKKGVKLGKAEVDLFTRTFCETVKAAGYPTGIYLNNDYRLNYYYPDTLRTYNLWLADYTGGPDVPCLIQQTGETVINGIPGKTDTNVWIGTYTENVQTPKNCLQKGDKGTAVKEMQNKLIFCGYSCGSTGADSDFGKNTFTAVELFQGDHNISVTGIYDAATKEMLDKVYDIISIYKRRVS